MRIRPSFALRPPLVQQDNGRPINPTSIRASDDTAQGKPPKQSINDNDDRPFNTPIHSINTGGCPRYTVETGGKTPVAINDKVLLRRCVVLLVVVTILVTLWWLIPLISTGPTGFSSPPSLSVTLKQIPSIKQRQRILGYNRTQVFGDGWASAPNVGPGCTIRQRQLMFQLPGTTLDNDCHASVATGIGPYTGKPIGGAFPVELDHILPLAAAWDLGAWRWDYATRNAFANDPNNLVVVSKAANREKGDALPSHWLPSNRDSQCWYVRRVAAIAAAYQLPLPVADRRTMIMHCPNDWFALLVD